MIARALVDGASDRALSIVQERDVSEVTEGEIHVYGHDETLAAVRARAREGIVVRGHGAGMGVAVITAGADREVAAEGLAADVVPFDQRGCLSPRLAIVEGDERDAAEFASTVSARLALWDERVPRGALWSEERAAAHRWRDALAFAGRLWTGPTHAVALAPATSPLLVPPPGRHVLVAFEPSLPAVAARLAPLAPFIVTVGTDDIAAVIAVAPPHARLSPLGRMQRPPLDGPVDLR